MEFSLERAKPVLSSTPATLRALLIGLPEEWTSSDEGPGTWSPWQVLGHLTHIEEIDWMDRTRRILASPDPVALEPVDREAGFEEFKGWSIAELLDHFESTRRANLEELDRLVSVADLARVGLHPTFGEVSLGELLAAWVVHDLNHLDQIAKTMAKQFREAVGPWRAFLPVVDAE